MSFYTHFHQRGGAIFLRWVDDQGKRRTTVVRDFQPTLYVKTNEETGYTSIFGDNVKPIQQEGIKEAKDFIQRYEGVDGFTLFGNTNWDYSYINERWPMEEIPYKREQVSIYMFDIETEVGDEFPDPMRADQRINLITILTGKRYVIWSFQDFDETKFNKLYDFPVEKRIFNDEDAMLKNFMAFWTGNYPDALIGYNSSRFDVPYIVNRVRQRLGEEVMKTLSPVGQVKEYQIDAKTVGYRLIGVEHLDYILMYKKFIPGERDFTLDAVAEDHLHEGKLENPFATFREFYEKDFQRFAQYNCRDVHILYRLDEKLRFIPLLMGVAYMTKVNYEDVLGTVKAWDAYIQNYLYSQKKFVPAVFSPKQPDRSIIGGYVKDPIPGRYEWVVSFDANSLYPSIIRSFNISPETILAAHEVPEELAPWYDRLQIDSMAHDEELTPLLEKHNLAMTANGHFFKREKQGVIPFLMSKVYNDRVNAKNEMKKHKKELVAIEAEMKRRGLV